MAFASCRSPSLPRVGPTIKGGYVRRVVRMANELEADLAVLTGDLVDGSVARLAPHVAALGELQPAARRFFVLGNHECYSGAAQWIEHFRALGIHVLLNEYRVIAVGAAKIVLGGVLDPATGQAPRPDLAAGAGEGTAFRLLLAHNPKIAPLAEQAGFDLQLSGHTHAGQFFPWTLAVRLVHAPHVSGLSRSGRMRVYVSAGTGSWGPPVRFGSQPELTLSSARSPAASPARAAHGWPAWDAQRLALRSTKPLRWSISVFLPRARSCAVEEYWPGMVCAMRRTASCMSPGTSHAAALATARHSSHHVAHHRGMPRACTSRP